MDVMEIDGVGREVVAEPRSAGGEGGGGMGDWGVGVEGGSVAGRGEMRRGVGRRMCAGGRVRREVAEVVEGRGDSEGGKLSCNNLR